MTAQQTAHFVIGVKAGNAGFACTFVTENGTEVLASGYYASAQDAEMVAQLIQSHAGAAERYERLDAMNGVSSFNLNDRLGQSLARSVDFSSGLARELAIERTMTSAPSALVVRE